MAEREEFAEVLLFSDDSATRAAIKGAVGRRAAKDVPQIRWDETATAAAVLGKLDEKKYDLLILDGEASKEGGMSVSRTLHEEVFDVPPTIILIARQQDAWLADWSLAEACIPAPFDPRETQETVARLLRAER
ncbi:MAG TPA: hypothetical protein VFC82_08485 [Actinomycetaceae bacterium]|nr:hypothetical protein [Actinomycetaceae bacterium]